MALRCVVLAWQLSCRSSPLKRCWSECGRSLDILSTTVETARSLSPVVLCHGYSVRPGACQHQCASVNDRRDDLCLSTTSWRFHSSRDSGISADAICTERNFLNFHSVMYKGLEQVRWEICFLKQFAGCFLQERVCFFFVPSVHRDSQTRTSWMCAYEYASFTVRVIKFTCVNNDEPLPIRIAQGSEHLWVS